VYFFYSPDISGNLHSLNKEESSHAVRVLRLKKGDTVHLTDGRGGLYRAEITENNHKKCAVKVIDVQKEYGKRDFYLHIAITPTKNISRFEWFLEKAVEIGIDEITPVICEHSERKVLKTDRLSKILIAAMKQSLEAYLPKLNEAINYADFVRLGFDGQKFIAHYSEKVKESLQKEYKPGNNALILIGPEGDFSQNELELAVKNGYQPVGLGKSRLRTETAALVACHTINLLNEN